MTRVNAHIPVKNLVNKHLFAEFHEMTRIAQQLYKRLEAKQNDFEYVTRDVPANFTLGTGHQTFFIDKGLYLKKRYDDLYEELKRRNYRISGIFDWENFYKNKPEYYNDYHMKLEDNQLLIDRISERLKTMSNIKYYDKTISVQEAIELLKS